jgi:hypothetical protein
MRAQLSILALFAVRSTLVRAEIEFRCSPVVIAQHVGRSGSAQRPQKPWFSRISRICCMHNRFLAIPARCASMFFFQAGAPRIGLSPKPGLSRESQRVLSRVHKTF